MTGPVMRCDRCSAAERWRAWQTADGAWWGLSDDGDAFPLGTFDLSEGDDVETTHFVVDFATPTSPGWVAICDECGWEREGHVDAEDWREIRAGV